MTYAKDDQALLLWTSRLLLDWISIAVDSGEVSRQMVENLIDFSAEQVIQGAPHLADQVNSFAELTKKRLPTK